MVADDYTINQLQMIPHYLIIATYVLNNVLSQTDVYQIDLPGC